MTPDPVLAVEQALTAMERRIILERVAGTNLEGADVADLLDIWLDSDSYLQWTEPFWEGNPGVMPADRERQRALAYCVLARAVLDRDVPKLGDVLRLWEKTLEAMGL